MIVVHVIRKPLAEPTVAQNAMRFSTGGLNIDGCRLPLGGHRSGDTPGSGQLGTGRTYGKANEAITLNRRPGPPLGCLQGTTSLDGGL